MADQYRITLPGEHRGREVKGGIQFEDGQATVSTLEPTRLAYLQDYVHATVVALASPADLHPLEDMSADELRAYAAHQHPPIDLPAEGKPLDLLNVIMATAQERHDTALAAEQAALHPETVTREDGDDALNADGTPKTPDEPAQS